MKLVKFKDVCTILRNTGTYDEYDNPEQETIYEGPCNYQEGSVSSTGIIIRKPTLYLPSNDVLVYINDIVLITTETGREINGIAELARDMRFVGLSTQITKIELKQGIGYDVRRVADEDVPEPEPDEGEDNENIDAE